MPTEPSRDPASPPRRAVLAAIASLALAPGRAGARDGALPVIAVLSWWAAPRDDAPVDRDFLAALARFGWEDGRTARIEFHWTAGDADRAAAVAADLVRRRVDVIVPQATPAALIAKAATSSIPIVFRVADPLASGLVTNLARPGGNVTGASIMSTEISGKRLELLREAMPHLRRIAFLGSSHDPNGAIFAAETEAAAGQFGLAASRHMADGPADFRAALPGLLAARPDAVIVQPILLSQREALAAFGFEHGLPMISDQPEFAEAGFPLAYGADRLSNIRGAALYVDRVLRGVDPGELPVQQATAFRLVVNLSAARRLKLAIPPALLARADEVIE